MTEKFQQKNGGAVAVIRGAEAFPWLPRGAKFQMSVGPFQDHGRPAWAGSAIKSHPIFLRAAQELSDDERRRANDRFRIDFERVLDRDQRRNGAVLSHPNPNVPAIQKAVIGDDFGPRGLRLYYQRTQLNEDPALVWIAVARTPDSNKVERVLYESGYVTAWKKGVIED